MQIIILIGGIIRNKCVYLIWLFSLVVMISSPINLFANAVNCRGEHHREHPYGTYQHYGYQYPQQYPQQYQHQWAWQPNMHGAQVYWFCRYPYGYYPTVQLCQVPWINVYMPPQ